MANVYLQCMNCLHNVIEFPSTLFKDTEGYEFDCPECEHHDRLLPNQSVAEYADQFELTVTTWAE